MEEALKTLNEGGGATRAFPDLLSVRVGDLGDKRLAWPYYMASTPQSEVSESEEVNDLRIKIQAGTLGRNKQISLYEF